MPTVFEPKDLPAVQHEGFSLTTLANSAMLGSEALQVERIQMEGNTNTSSFEPMNAERFLYVVRGDGQAQMENRAFPLEPESVLWIEPEDCFSLRAGENGLEVLVCRAPGMN